VNEIVVYATRAQLAILKGAGTYWLGYWNSNSPPEADCAHRPPVLAGLAGSL
jgi:hypothetical protein